MDSQLRLDCPHAPTPIHSLGHLSTNFISNDPSLLPNKCASAPLRPDPVHLSRLSLHARAPMFFQVMRLGCDKLISSTSMFSRLVAFTGILQASYYEIDLRSETGDASPPSSTLNFSTHELKRSPPSWGSLKRPPSSCNTSVSSAA